MPTPIVAGKRMNLVDDDGSHVFKERSVVNSTADQHHLDGFGRGQQEIRRVSEDRAPRTFTDIAMPHCRSASDEGSVLTQPRLEIIEKSAERTHVQDRK